MVIWCEIGGLVSEPTPGKEPCLVAQGLFGHVLMAQEITSVLL